MVANHHAAPTEPPKPKECESIAFAESMIRSMERVSAMPETSTYAREWFAKQMPRLRTKIEELTLNGCQP